MQEKRKKEIRIAAEIVREKCQVGRYGINNLFRDCERIGCKSFRYPFQGNVKLGLSMRRGRDIVIYTNSAYRLSREIFTLAHELGHIALHLDKASSFMDTRATISGLAADVIEQEANFFAACLLMPGPEVDKFMDLELDTTKRELSAMDIARLMAEFNVSFDMVLNRLENLGKIDARHHLLLDNEKNEKRVGNLLRAVGGDAKLNAVSNEISLPYEFIDYVIYNYNHNAIPRETLEKVLVRYKLTPDDVFDRLVINTDKDENLDALIGSLE